MDFYKMIIVNASNRQVSLDLRIKAINEIIKIPNFNFNDLLISLLNDKDVYKEVALVLSSFDHSFDLLLSCIQGFSDLSEIDGIALFAYFTSYRLSSQVKFNSFFHPLIKLVISSQINDSNLSFRFLITRVVTNIVDASLKSPSHFQILNFSCRLFYLLRCDPDSSIRLLVLEYIDKLVLYYIQHHPQGF